MDRASQELEQEHESILKTLKVLDKMVSMLRKNEAVEYQDIIDIIDFIKIFADKCHHGKEEGLYFSALSEVGFSSEHGPVGVMLEDHKEGREYVKQMTESVENNTLKSDKFIKAASSYVYLLTNHIAKENNILYPMGDERLTKAMQDDLLNKFRKFEEDEIGHEKHHELLLLLDNFEKKYLH